MANPPTPLNYRFSALDVPELEKIGTQQSIIEDKQGFTWFGGFNGLARFDGYDVVTYRHDPLDDSSLSYNGVSDLLLDSKGRLWVATYQGLNRYDEFSDHFIRYTPASSHPLPTDKLSKLVEDHHGHIWVGTRGHGLLKIDAHTEQHQPVQFTGLDDARVEGSEIRALHLDTNGLIWVGVHNRGLMVLDPELGTLSRPKDNSGITRNIAINVINESPEGDIWIGTSSSGLIRLDPTTGDTQHFLRTTAQAHSLHHNSVWDIYFDQQGQLWVAADDSLELYQSTLDGFIHFSRLPGTSLYGKVRALHQTQSGHFWLGMFPSGTAYLDIDATVFRNFVSEPANPNSLIHTSVTAIVEDAKGHFWIGTEGGLDYFDSKRQTFKHFQHKDGDIHSLPSNSVISLHIDHTDTLWVGTWKGGWARFDEATQSFFPAKMHDGSQAHMNAEVWDIFEDKSGQLWVGGLYLYDRPNDVFYHYSEVYPDGDRLNSDRVNIMYEDKEGQFWIGTIAGLNLFDRQTGKITHYKPSSEPHSISDDILMSAMEDTEGNLWFGTHGGGINLYNREQNNFTHIGATQGLYDNSITGMVDDRNGGIWMTSGSGLIHYKKSTQEFELFDQKNGLKADLFHRNAIILSKEQLLVFGGAGGLAILNPAELKKNRFIPPIVLTKLEILNQTATPNTHPRTLDQPINVAKHITLNHDDNVFTLHYSALNFRLSGQNRYAYKLEGFDKHWHFVDHVRRATYTNLDPGQYVFKVKGSNNSGLWNEQGTQLTITITPPWWQTPLAYTLYVLILAGLGYVIFYTLLTLKQAKNERKLNAQLKEVAELKDTFLANTSHELRTPLNGIIGLAESLLAAPESISQEEAKHKLSVVANSGKRLSNIINDILDFSKLRDHDIELNKTPVNIYRLVRDIATLSEPLIDNKPLQIINIIDKDFPLFNADEQRLSQILLNIIGNAIKFTEHGEIEVSAEIEGDKIKIQVRDSGIGIGKDDCARIFLPFEQALNSSKKGSIGTGLGLAITKKLVELHGGRIYVSSREGAGSTFTVSLPFMAADSSTTMQIQQNAKIQTGTFSPLRKLTKRSNKKPAHQSNVHILIVDDEPVNRMVLEGYLSLENYQITECNNGEDAITLINETPSIDIVLLDIMMPGISGFDVCETIRQTRKLLDLPILFLTAKSQKNDLTRGYDVGANDFILKPVVKEELLAKIKLHLNVRAEHQKILSST